MKPKPWKGWKVTNTKGLQVYCLNALCLNCRSTATSLRFLRAVIAASMLFSKFCLKRRTTSLLGYLRITAQLECKVFGFAVNQLGDRSWLMTLSLSTKELASLHSSTATVQFNIIQVNLLGHFSSKRLSRRHSGDMPISLGWVCVLPLKCWLARTISSLESKKILLKISASSTTCLNVKRRILLCRHNDIHRRTIASSSLSLPRFFTWWGCRLSTVTLSLN